MRSLLFTILMAVYAYGNTSGTKQCGTTMCVSVTVDGSNAEYVLSSTGKSTLGWMAIGFGQQMSGSPMVIMWSNSDGNVTLSQRTAPYEIEPTLDSNPPRIATLSESLTSTLGADPTFGFTIPSNGITNQSVIYAFSDTAPSSSDVNATIVKHIDHGVFQFDLVSSTKWLPYQHLALFHAIFCSVGFVSLLPAGALVARHLRTFKPRCLPHWFTLHWVTQFVLGGSAISVGFALGCRTVTEAGHSHFDDKHKVFGLVIFLLYVLQCVMGAAVHFRPPKQGEKRPIQNYVHAVLGLLIIALGLYLIKQGGEEWMQTMEIQLPLPSWSGSLYLMQVISFPILYVGGLLFLRRQFRQEKAIREKAAAEAAVDHESHSSDDPEKSE